MAGRKENLKSLFTNTRTRVIIVFTTVLLVLAVAIGYIKLRSATEGPTASAEVTGIPSIQSIPGAQNTTPQYSNLLESQNITQAIQALKSGASAQPTLASTQALGEGINSVKSSGGQSGVGFATMALGEQLGAQQTVWVQDLKDKNCSRTAIKTVLGQGGKLKDIRAACTCVQLKNAGYLLRDLRAVCQISELRGIGYTVRDLRGVNFTAQDLIKAGVAAEDLRNAGFSSKEIEGAGTGNSQVTLPSPVIEPSQVGRAPAEAADNAANARHLQAILAKQNQQMSEQKNQQKIQQRMTEMLTAANMSVQSWKKIATQVYVAGHESKNVTERYGVARRLPGQAQLPLVEGAIPPKAVVKTGDIIFAVIDTSVNSDEPGPILATVVSGRLKGAKLIGGFNLPPNANKMIITFNTLSIPGAAKSINISAFGIDPNTARTALSSRTNHHYLLRYGSLFASSFLEGFGNAIQASKTAITIGGTGGGNNITVQTGFGQSTLQSAVIGLATVGKTWGQQAQIIFNTPTTVQVYSGTGIGILFMQDVIVV